MMNEYGKSDSSIVLEKLPNKARQRVVEAMEERGLAKGNPLKRNASRTQSRTRAHSALERIRRAAPSLSFGALWRYHLRQEPYELVAHVRIWGAADKAAIQRVKVPPCQLPDSGM